MRRPNAIRSIFPLLLLLVAGCDRQGKPIDFVVPKKLTGPIWLIVATDAPDISLVNGRYQVTVPANGVLHVRSTKLFEQWHRSSAKLDDGSPLPVADQDECSPYAVALHGGAGGKTQENGKTTQWMVFYVGTTKQHTEWSSGDFLSGMPR